MPATPVMMSEDRRSLTVRLSSLQYIIAIIFAVLAVAFWVFQVAQHEKFEQIAEENHLRRLPLPAPRGVLFDRHGKVLVENQTTVQHRARARADEGPRSDAARPGAGDRRGRSADAGDGEPPPPRAELPADRAHRERGAGAVVRRRARGTCRASSISPCRRGNTRRASWPRTSSATSARSPKRSSCPTSTAAPSRARSSATPASRRR